MTDTYIGKGTVYLGLRNGSDALRDIGNCSILSFAAEEETREMIDYQNAGGGKLNELKRISGVSMEITMLELKPENIAIAVFGTASAVSAGTVTDEAHSLVKQGGLVPFANIPDPAQSVTVTGTGGTPTYVEDTDYRRVTAGIEIIVGGSIADDTALLVDYTKKAGNVVEALLNSGLEYRMVFSGVNEAESGRQVVVTAHRVKFGPGQSLGFIGDEFAELQVTGEVLKDPAITAAGKSQFYKAELAA